MSRSEHPALEAARRALKADKGPPPLAYCPPPSTFRGKRPKLHPEQLDLYGREHDGR
jgi:hypothetical protein